MRQTNMQDGTGADRAVQCIEPGVAFFFRQGTVTTCGKIDELHTDAEFVQRADNFPDMAAVAGGTAIVTGDD